MTNCLPPFSRRRFLRTGLGAAALAFGWRPAGASAPGAAPRARHVILLWMNGGPSQLETFDPRPGSDIGGPFGAIATTVSGMRFSERLPKLARQARHLAVIRSLTSREGDHDRARVLLHTGEAPTGAVERPSLGAVISRECARAGRLGSVALLGRGAGPGLLGSAHAPLIVADPDQALEGWFPDGFEPDELRDRFETLAQLERVASPGELRLASAFRAAREQTRDFLGSPVVRALSMEGESPRTRTAYGRTAFGKGCILARRLVEAGVPFVEVTLDGWDSHVENFRAHTALTAILDPAFSALLADLSSRGLLGSTLVVWAGEFGRSPRINAARGRDHHPGAFSAVLAGGGIRGGQVVGSTDPRTGEVAERPVPVADMLATVYSSLGVPLGRIYNTPEGRPVPLLDKATPVTELL